MVIMKKILMVAFALLLLSIQGRAQSSSEMADRIGMPGFWKMVSMYGMSQGERFNQD